MFFREGSMRQVVFRFWDEHGVDRTSYPQTQAAVLAAVPGGRFTRGTFYQYRNAYRRAHGMIITYLHVAG